MLCAPVAGFSKYQSSALQLAPFTCASILVKLTPLYVIELTGLLSSAIAPTTRMRLLPVHVWENVKLSPVPVSSFAEDTASNAIAIH